MLFLVNLQHSILLDSPDSWQLFFQNPATPYMQKLIELHEDIMFCLFIIVILVMWLLLNIIMFFSTVSTFYRGFYSFIFFNVNLEIFWTLVPSFLLILIIIPSFILLYNSEIYVHPEKTVKILGNQWYWTYETNINNIKILKYDSLITPENRLTSGGFRLLESKPLLILPTGVHIRLLISSLDVLHSWAVPSLGIKMDACPGRLNQVSLFINREAYFYGQCSEICGIYHSSMPIEVCSKKF